MHQNTLGGQSPSGPAGELTTLIQAPWGSKEVTVDRRGEKGRRGGYGKGGKECCRKVSVWCTR